MVAELTGEDNDKIQIVVDPQDTYVVDQRLLCEGLPFVLTDAAHPRLILKYGNDFLVLDGEGNIPGCNTLGYGYYHGDTRHLSEWALSLDDVDFSLLTFDVEKGYAGSFLYTNPQTPALPQQKIVIQRQLVLSDLISEMLTLENFHSAEVKVELRIKFQSDFADMFEVRGMNRVLRGQRMQPKTDSSRRTLYLAYRGLDDCLLETVIEFKGLLPDEIVDGQALFRLTLAVREPVTLELLVYTRCNRIEASVNRQHDFASILRESDSSYAAWKRRGASVITDNEIVNRTLNRGLRDLYILRQETPHGSGIAAGIPWYSAVFGRDSAIVGWQMLPFRSELAREALELLSAYQGTCVDIHRAESPGKIMHELRAGELARIGQIPHTPYYGTVDATALWLILMARYFDWSGDFEFIKRHWSRIELALQWLDEASQSGFVRYMRESADGLENQGWKDSGDAICHVNGEPAKPPIALCEAQGYLYAAQMAIADLAEQTEYASVAAALRFRARQLKERFLRDFWMLPTEYPALALDGEGNQVTAISSNAGHCLWSGLLDGVQGNLVADRLMGKELNSGWGFRTLSSECTYYNPISYHNGSIWPHDNALIIEGLRKIGRLQDCHTIMKAMIDVAENQQDFRLPELICGFERTDWRKPISYPVSCSPQAWAAGSIFQILATCLNLQPDARNRILRIVEPGLPPWLESIKVEGLRVGQAQVDIVFENDGGNTYCRILRKRGQLRVVIES